MRLNVFVAACAVFSLLACSHDTKPDLDATPSLELPVVPQDFQVEDSIDGDKDPVDFKVLNVREEGKAAVRIGLERDHKVRGAAAILEDDGKTEVTGETINPGDEEVVLEFDADKIGSYYLKVTAIRGASPYTVSYALDAGPKDPCEDISCGDNEYCEDGECIEDEPEVCSPQCKYGYNCVNGSCEKACDGGCPTGELCNVRTNKCYKNPCYGVKCGAGQKCSAGKCVSTAPAKKECKPACQGGQTCNTKTGKCEGQVASDECSGPVSGSITQIIPQGSKSVLMMTPGSNKCVKVGQTGSISGIGNFRITDVYDFRSKAIIDKDSKSITLGTKIVIHR